MDLEREYLPSLSIPETKHIFESWRQRAAATRAKLKFQTDIRYGAHPREVMDFYPAENATGCLVFIHGGYWCSFSKNETSWIAKGFVGQNLSVALINYPLCPDVGIGDIRASCTNAFVHLYQNVLSEAERKTIVVAGHSAGGYLAAAHLAEDWTRHGLPENPVAGVLAVSGVFDVAPLIETSLNEELRLTPEMAQQLNLVEPPLRSSAPLVLAVGAQESEEFHRQSRDLADRWKKLSPILVDVKDSNHFTVLDSLAAPGAQLNRLAVGFVRG